MDQCFLAPIHVPVPSAHNKETRATFPPVYGWPLDASDPCGSAADETPGHCTRHTHQVSARRRRACARSTPSPARKPRTWPRSRPRKRAASRSSARTSTFNMTSLYGRQKGRDSRLQDTKALLHTPLVLYKAQVLERKHPVDSIRRSCDHDPTDE